MNQEFRVSRLAQVKRVLVLHDLGADADNAAWRAGMLARRHGGWLRVLHLSRFGNAEEARTRLAPLAWRLQEHLQIAVLAQAVRGPFTEELRRAAEEADLIVISPPSALAAATGSHPLRVARLAGRPTLVVRTSATTPYRRVLVGEGADRGLDHGRAVAHSMSDGKEVPVLASLGSAGELLDRERALFPDLVVLPCPQTVSIARRFLAHTRADTLLVPVSRATARAR
ncbi:MAG: universal stress protein, partial [Myxococcales bacterium]